MTPCRQGPGFRHRRPAGRSRPTTGPGRAGVEGLDHDIVRLVDDVGVVAQPACHRVGAGAAVQDVLAGVADERIGKPVARAVEVAGAEQLQLLQVGAQSPADPRIDRIRPLVRALRDDVAALVDDTGIVAGAARHRVGAGATVQQIVARKTAQEVVAVTGDNDVVVRIADALNGVEISQRQVLQIVGKRPGNFRLDRVDPAGIRLDNGSSFDDINIVAEATIHRGIVAPSQDVVAGAAVQPIRPTGTVQDVVAVAAADVSSIVGATIPRHGV